MLHTFWINLISSIYNPEFYKGIMAGEEKKTRSFVFLFSLCAAVIVCVFMYVPMNIVRKAAIDAPKYVNEAYPEAMVLTVSPAGDLSVAGVTEPVVIGFGSLSGPALVNERVKNLAVIDTATPYTPEAHKESGSFAWAGKTFITADGARATNRRMYAYIDMMRGATETVTVTKTDADKAARAIAGFAGYIVLTVMLATLVFTTLFYMFGMLVFGVIIGAMLWILANKLQVGVLRKGGAGISYIAAMRAAIFAGVLPSIVMMVSWFTPVTLTYGMYTLATLLIVFINMRGASSKPAANN
jgi:hypothetical protein